ncbi:MAG: hypothetical protein K6G89_00345 [Clostridia bacterium]|nr:hypothetical protein [Clostridia bacterium]
MKMKIFSKITVLAVMICILASLAPVTASSMGLQEQSWLSHLRPSSMPGTKARDSFPVELLISIPTQEEIKLKGTCSLEGKLTDDDILDAIKKAAASVEGYKSPENAVNDKLRIDQLKNKLSFSQEEQDRIVKNWLSLVGMDKVADLLKGQLPSYGETDAVGVVVDLIKDGKLPDAGALVPFPTNAGAFGQGLVINGVFLTYDQYKRDQEKYKDIVEFSNVRARFRQFTANLNYNIKEMTRNYTAWTIRIHDRVVKEQLYRGSPEIYAPYIYTADIVLVKKDKDIDSYVGTYKGEFKIDVDVSLEDYDRNFGKYLAESINKKLKEIPGPISDSMMWYVVSNNANRTSENKTTLEGKNVYVTLSDSLGGVFEMKLDPTALDIAYNKVLHDIVSVIEQKSEGATATTTWTEITDSEAGTAYHQDHNVVVDINGNRQESTNTDDDPYPNDDPRSIINLTLVVDTVG